MWWLDFLSWFLGGGLGAYGGTTIARLQARKADRREHDRQMADWDARLDFLKQRQRVPMRLWSPN